jgi:hypothetical protein
MKVDLETFVLVARKRGREPYQAGHERQTERFSPLLMTRLHTRLLLLTWELHAVYGNIKEGMYGTLSTPWRDLPNLIQSGRYLRLILCFTYRRVRSQKQSYLSMILCFLFWGIFG